MIKAILFDLDNTLLDFLTFKKETAKAAAKAMIKHGLPDDEMKIYGKIGLIIIICKIHQQSFVECFDVHQIILDVIFGLIHIATTRIAPAQ